MLKKFCVFIMFLFFAVSAYADEHKKIESDHPRDYSLILIRNLPHPMPYILSNYERLGITDEQKKEFEKILAEVPPLYYAKANRAMALEKEISEKVLKEGKTFNELQSSIETLMKSKRDVTEIHINVISKIKKILNNEQYEAVLTAIKKPL